MRHIGLLLISCVLCGCGTTRQTDTVRAATEMLLVSQAIDQAIEKLDFSPLAGKTVFLDMRNLDPTVVDRGYLVSSLRQQILAAGGLLQDDRERAAYVVEPRSGGIGTDRNTLLVGTPQVTIPAMIPGVPTSIPEIALIKRTDQRGIAKVAVFAYHRETGRALWQSGMSEYVSSLKDTWVLGAGPFSKGSIRERAEFAGESLPTLPTISLGTDEDEGIQIRGPYEELHRPVSMEQPFQWTNSDDPIPPQPVPFALIGLVGPAAVVDRPLMY